MMIMVIDNCSYGFHLAYCCTYRLERIVSWICCWAKL